MFTRQHLVELAGVVRTVAQREGESAARNMADRLATMLQRTTPRFDESIWYAACFPGK